MFSFVCQRSNAFAKVHSFLLSDYLTLQAIAEFRVNANIFFGRECIFFGSYLQLFLGIVEKLLIIVWYSDDGEWCAFVRKSLMSEALKIAVSGLNAAVSRIANAASNLVNASSTGRLPTQPGEKAASYQPTDVVTLSDSADDNALGVHTVLQPREPAYVMALDPRSPHANAAGLVAAPNVDMAAEIMNAKLAEVTYRANAAVIRAVQKTDKDLLDTLA
jgi:flagellar basal-body rod protein FlgC